MVGNIARHVIPARKEIFLQSFKSKGRFYNMLADIPIVVVTDPLVGVRGAVCMAKELADLQEKDATRVSRKAARKNAKP